MYGNVPLCMQTQRPFSVPNDRHLKAELDGRVWKEVDNDGPRETLWHEAKAGEGIGTYQESGGVAASKHLGQPHTCDLCCDAILIQQYIARLDVKYYDVHQAIKIYQRHLAQPFKELANA